MYDGYIVAVAGGALVGAVSMNQCEPPPPLTDPRRRFTDVGVPIIHVTSQSDYLIGIAGRQPDGDAPLHQFRHDEMAGAGHATPDELYFSAAPDDIVEAGRAVPPERCNEGPRSRFPSHIFFDAILANLDAWVRDGVPPPSADVISVFNSAPVVDQFGNVVGGLRSPYLDVPTSTWFGSATGASFCFRRVGAAPYAGPARRPLPEASRRRAAGEGQCRKARGRSDHHAVRRPADPQGGPAGQRALRPLQPEGAAGSGT
jgi:Alpha/beta hydrolase domain